MLANVTHKMRTRTSLIAFMVKCQNELFIVANSQRRTEPVTPEIKVAGDFVGENGFVIDKAFEMDQRHSSIGQQDRQRWFSCAGFIFGDPRPSGLKGMLRCQVSRHF